MLKLCPLLLLALACKATDVPARGSAESSVLGVRVNITTYLSHNVSILPYKVYFARLPKGPDSLLQADELVESNYQRGALSMLLNAQPGQYAIVCAVATWEGRDHYVYVSETGARESLIEIKAGQYLYMGSLSLNETRSFSKADALQRRTAGLVRAGPAHPNIWQELFPRAMEYIGEPGSFSRSSGDVERTEKSMRQILARYGW